MFQASANCLLVVAIWVPEAAFLTCAIRIRMRLVPAVDTIRELVNKTTAHIVEILIRGVRVKVHVTLENETHFIHFFSCERYGNVHVSRFQIAVMMRAIMANGSRATPNMMMQPPPKPNSSNISDARFIGRICR